MAVTKTDFINYSRCPRYVALDEIHKERLDADITYEKYLEEEKVDVLSELVGMMYETDEDGEDIDLVNVKNRQLEAMLKYYKQVEIEAAKLADKTFGGKTKAAVSTKNQECFDFSRDGIRYLCYVDIYNESEEHINIIEVKASTTNLFLKIGATINKEFHSIFERIGNILYLKDEIPGKMLENEMPYEKYETCKNKLFDRFKEGKYVYDLAIQRYIIENEYKQSNNEAKLNNFRYYLAVLNHEYTFDGTYEDRQAVYNPDEFGNELINFIDLTKVTKEFQPLIEEDAKKIENYIRENNVAPYPLNKACEHKKQTICKYFQPICGKVIPKYNSSLNYMDNGHGFKDESGYCHKGLDLINEGYINMLDIPEEWIKSENHHIQRNVLRTNVPFIDKEKLKIALDSLEYPIYHLDFETFPCPVPRFRGEHPYTQSPFEFSLHIEHEPGVCDKDKDNYIFLAATHEDEREELVKRLLRYIDPNKGTLFAQNVAFEKSRIKELAAIFPEYKTDLMKIYNMGFDLIWLVKTKQDLYKDLGFEENIAKRVNFYHPDLCGSYSIKKTLPVFSNLKYDSLDVKNGTEAIVEYANYPYMSAEEFKLKYDALLEYCKQDTWAMVLILGALRTMVN